MNKLARTPLYQIIIVLSSILFVGLFVAAHPAPAAAEETTLLAPEYTRLDAATVTRGYTVTGSDEALRVGVLPAVFSEPIIVEVKEWDASEVGDSAPQVLASKLYSFDLDGAPAERFIRPIAVSMAFTSQTLTEKSIYFWNKPTATWVRLPSRVDWNTKTVRAPIHLSFALLAVLEDPTHTVAEEGDATWYRSRKTMSAANNLFDLDSLVRVTNLDTGTSVVVRVVSRGPYTTGRVVDLTLDAFREIADQYRGIARVRVEAAA